MSGTASALLRFLVFFSLLSSCGLSEIHSTLNLCSPVNSVELLEQENNMYRFLQELCVCVSLFLAWPEKPKKQVKAFLRETDCTKFSKKKKKKKSGPRLILMGDWW